MKKKSIIFAMICCLLLSGFIFKKPTFAVDNIMNIGENDTILNQIITDCLKNNTGNWQKYLDTEFMNLQQSFRWNMDNDVIDNWKWDGSIDAVKTGDPSLDPNNAPQLNDDGYMEVYSVQQFIGALSVAQKIKIMRNLDFMGYQYNWSQSVNLMNHEIDGNGRVFYNIGSNKSFINTMKMSVMKNITFDSVKMASDAEILLGIIGNSSSGNGTKSTLYNVRVQNSMFFSAYAEYNAIMGKASYVAPIAEAKDMIAEKVTAANNITYAIKAHTGGTFGIVEHTTITDSYSVDSTIIAGGNHSGGFISCSDGEVSVKDSFTNNIVYGNQETGVFIGAIVPNYASRNKSAIFENCFSSGSIEGKNQLGGFIGIIGDGYSLKIEFRNSYSTSIVGMRNGGKNLGGFVGAIKAHTAEYIFENCYAAGEVGSIDTDISDNRGPSSVGGFVGSLTQGSPNTFINCYYDKQTTAMREWATGDTTGSSITGNAGDSGSRDYISPTDVGTNNYEGIKGVLTSDSDKFGRGLAAFPVAPEDSNSPHLTTGFTGFIGDTYNKVLPTNPNWIYDGGNANEKVHNCMYPQLSVFFNSDDVFKRAYSYASVATVEEQVWDSSANEEILPERTYDTVRDLTLRFMLTSYVNNTTMQEDVNVKWKKDNAFSVLYGENKNVIGTLERIENPIDNRQNWTADKFSPGIEWVTVNFEVKDESTGKTAIGSRRLRIIATSNIQSGKDNYDVLVGSSYNHAKDAFFAYSTAQRMASNKDDITTGPYPDAYPFEEGDIRNNIQKIPPLLNGTITDFYRLYDDKYRVSGEFLTGVEAGINKVYPDNIINVNIYDVKAFQQTDDTNISEIIYILDGKTKYENAILTPELLKSQDAAIKEKTELWADKFNGTKDFEMEDIGHYLIEYEWIIPDGRYMRDSKMIMVQPKEHKAEIVVKNMDGSFNNQSLQLKIASYEYDTQMPNRMFEDVSSNQTKQIQHFNVVDLAFKKVNDATEIKKIQFEITTNDMPNDIQNHTIAIDNVVVDQPFSVPMKYYYNSFEEGGKYFAKVIENIREYTLKYDSVNNFYYLTMNNKFTDDTTGLKRFDLENDVTVTVFVEDNKKESQGTATIFSQTFVNNIQTYTNDFIKYKVLNDQGNIVGEFSLTSVRDDNFIQLDLPIGEYTLDRVEQDEYEVKDIIVNGKTQTTKIGTFLVQADEHVDIIVNNVKITSTKEPIPTPSDPPSNNGVNTGDTSFLYFLGALSLISLFLVLYAKEELKKNKRKVSGR